MDKARIKYEAARNITKRYREIMRYMEEVYMHGKQLNNLLLFRIEKHFQIWRGISLYMYRKKMHLLTIKDILLLITKIKSF